METKELVRTAGNAELFINAVGKSSSPEEGYRIVDVVTMLGNLMGYSLLYACREAKKVVKTTQKVDGKTVTVEQELAYLIPVWEIEGLNYQDESEVTLAISIFSQFLPITDGRQELGYLYMDYEASLARFGLMASE
jgi:hypothetical protein